MGLNIVEPNVDDEVVFDLFCFIKGPKVLDRWIGEGFLVLCLVCGLGIGLSLLTCVCVFFFGGLRMIFVCEFSEWMAVSTKVGNVTLGFLLSDIL